MIAWKRAVRHLLKHGPTPNLIVEISNTVTRDDCWFHDYDPKGRIGWRKSLRDVADTIWPAKLAAKARNRAQFYKRYAEVEARGKKMHSRNRSSWGTYTLRLIAFGKTPIYDGINQLEVAISKINTWKSRTYAAFVFHLTSPELGGPRKQGGPCLQYIELLWNQDDSLDMVAVYRSHDYTNLALGNFIGLCDLLNFVSHETNKTSGKLTIHSVSAFIDGRHNTEVLLGGVD